jgi:hypothetical protein
MPQSSACDLDPEDLAGMGDDEVPDPLWQRGPTPRHRMLGKEGLLQGAPLGVREAHEDSLVAGKRFRWPAAGRHGLSDITISGNRTRGLDAPCGGRRGLLLLISQGRPISEGRMAAVRIVPALDEVEDRQARGRRAPEGLPVE